MKSKSRKVSLFLIAAIGLLITGLWSVQTKAAPADVKIDGVAFSATNRYFVNGSDATVSEVENDAWNAYINEAGTELHLKGFVGDTIVAENGPLTIFLEGDNTISIPNNKEGIYVWKGDLTIQEETGKSGSLTVNLTRNEFGYSRSAIKIDNTGTYSHNCTIAGSAEVNVNVAVNVGQSTNTFIALEAAKGNVIIKDHAKLSIHGTQTANVADEGTIAGIKTQGCVNILTDQPLGIDVSEITGGSFVGTAINAKTVTASDCPEINLKGRNASAAGKLILQSNPADALDPIGIAGYVDKSYSDAANAVSSVVYAPLVTKQIDKIEISTSGLNASGIGNNISVDASGYTYSVNKVYCGDEVLTGADASAAAACVAGTWQKYNKSTSTWSDVSTGTTAEGDTYRFKLTAGACLVKSATTRYELTDSTRFIVFYSASNYDAWTVEGSIDTSNAAYTGTLDYVGKSYQIHDPNLIYEISLSGITRPMVGQMPSVDGICLTSLFATPESVLTFAQYQDNTSTEITSAFEYNEDYDLFLQIEKNTADAYHTAYASAENITVSSGFSTDICTVDVYRADATHLQVTLHFAALLGCDVSFDANGGGGSMSQITIQRNAAQKLPACTFTPPADKEFAGWKVGETDTNIYQPGNSYGSTEATLTIHAQWRAVTSMLHFSAGEGTGQPMFDEVITQGQQFTLPTCAFNAPEGKEFDRWDLGALGKFKAGEKVTIPKSSVKEYTATALWKKIGSVGLDAVDISAYSVAKIADVVYTGKEIKPSVKLTGAGASLQAGTDYTVSYADNVKVGKATVTVTGKGKYEGTVTGTFVIKPMGTSVKKLIAGKKSFTVKYKKQAAECTGYEIQYSTSSGFKKAKTAVVKKSGTISKKVKKLKSKKKYYVRVRTYRVAGGVKYYSDWSKKKKVKVR